MKTKTIYFIILIALITIVLAGYLLPVSSIKHFSNSVYHACQNPWLIGGAAASAFIFLNSKHYWLINLGISFIVALGIILFHQQGINLYQICSKASGFMLIVYILNYIRLLIK